MTKFARLTFLLTAAVALTQPVTRAYAQLKLEEKETPLEVLAAVETDVAPQKTEVLAVYIPEPGTYGIVGAAALGLLLAFRRITIRSSALAG